MKWPLRAHYLNWHNLINRQDLNAKEKIFDVFGTLAIGNYPGALLKAGFHALESSSEYREQAAVIRQSLWLHGYNPLAFEPYNTEWIETIANYTAFLNMLKEHKNDDRIPLVLLAQAIHIGFEIEPSKNFEVDLDATMNFLHGYLDNNQAKRVRDQVLELQSAKGLHAREASQLLEGKSTISPGATRLYSFAAPAVFTTIVSSQPNVVNNVTIGDGTDWLIATGVAMAFTAGVWAWRKLPFFKSVEERTIQLVDKAVRTGNPSALMKYYLSANVNDKIKIVNIATETVAKKSDKVNPEIFENMFLDGLKAKSSDVIDNIQKKVISTLDERVRLGINAREMKAILDEAQRETGINVTKGNSVPIEPKFADIINSLARENNLNADAFMESMMRDIDLDMSIDRMLVNDFVGKVAMIHRESGDINKALKIVISDTSDRYNMGLDVNRVAAQAITGFSELNDRTVRLLRNEQFMKAFVDPYYEAAMKTLFASVLKYISLKQEAQSAALAKLVVQALHQTLKDDINYIDSMFPELPMLFARMAVEGKLQDRQYFVDQAKANRALASVMNTEQMRALHEAMVNLLEIQFEDSEKIKIEILASEFEKAGLASTRSGFLTSSLAAAILSASNGENVTLLKTPLSQVGQKIKDSGLDEQISEHYLFSRFEENQKERVKSIVRNLDAILINNLAISLTFDSVKEIVNQEITKLELKDIDETRAQIALLNTLSKNAVLTDQQAGRALQFENAVEEKVHELRYASAVALSSFAKVGAGTGPMVEQVKTYLREEVPNIRMDLIKNQNIKQELQAVVDELKVPEKRAEQVAEIIEKLSARSLAGGRNAMSVSVSAASDAISGVEAAEALRKESSDQRLKFTGYSDIVAPFMANSIIESAI
jgi:hypothetical protein